MSRYSNPHKTHCRPESSSIVLRSPCNRASCATGSIPSLRRRAKTAPEERSIWFPLLYLTWEKEADGPLQRSSHFFTTQHHKSGQGGCLITFGPLCRSRCRRTVRSPGFTKLIVRTVQFGPARPSFQAYPLSMLLPDCSVLHSFDGDVLLFNHKEKTDEHQYER